MVWTGVVPVKLNASYMGFVGILGEENAPTVVTLFSDHKLDRTKGAVGEAVLEIVHMARLADPLHCRPPQPRLR